MSENVENPSAQISGAPGSAPLGNSKWELYARERALCSSRMLAYRAAGFKAADDHVASANAAKLERTQEEVRNRIAWLCRQPEEVLRAKRQRLEEFKWTMLNADIGDYYVMVERPILDKEGNPVRDEGGEPMMRLAQELKPFTEMTAEQRSIIQSLKYTDSGRPNLELYSKQWAVVELRKMLGIGPDSTAVADEIADMTLEEMAEFISRERAAIGISELKKLANRNRDSAPR